MSLVGANSMHKKTGNSHGSVARGGFARKVRHAKPGQAVLMLWSKVDFFLTHNLIGSNQNFNWGLVHSYWSLVPSGSEIRS